ncbi:MAG: type II toxin-antitoxin system VapC family toxin [Deinococcus sp.]|nr:type II toxin-antitoxin system VapC family toxin [Deinococcus sp.]
MIVLDTHAWIWWASEPEKLSSRALAAINYSRAIGICPISCWEISTKVAQGKLTLDRDLRVWVQQALARPGVALLHLSADIAITAGQLGRQGFPGDPADRLIVATALHHGAELITKDKTIRSFRQVRTCW